MISIEDLTVRYGPRVVVEGVSFAMARGAGYALVGESGSGKTSVLRALAGLNADWTGRMLLDGTALPSRRSTALHRRIQMVFQDPYGSLHPRQTIDQVLAEPLAIHRLARAEQRISEALDAVSLPAAVRFRYPHQLSGGQRQRVAIARALIAEPDLVLLDEPTSALDVSVQAEILNLLQDLQGRRGLTYLLVTHNLAVAAHLCQTIGVMQRGRLVEELTAPGLRAGLTRHPHTTELYRLTAGQELLRAASVTPAMDPAGPAG